MAIEAERGCEDTVAEKRPFALPASDTGGPGANPGEGDTVRRRSLAAGRSLSLVRGTGGLGSVSTGTRGNAPVQSYAREGAADGVGRMTSAGSPLPVVCDTDAASFAADDATYLVPVSRLMDA